MDEKTKLLNDNIRLVKAIAKLFYGVEHEDLVQAGLYGLYVALKNYKNGSNTKFSSYAYKYIYGAMYDLVCNKEMKYGTNFLKLKSVVEKARNVLCQEILREPLNSEIAAYLNIDEELVEYVISINDSIVYLDDDTDKRNLHECISLKKQISVDDQILISDSINMLDPIERKIIKARYFSDLTQSETAKRLGITQVKVSRYETRSLKKMKDYMYM